jgi:protein required for attachment to host cells
VSIALVLDAELLLAGRVYGVAKNVTLHAVRVLDCDGSAMMSSLLKVHKSYVRLSNPPAAGQGLGRQAILHEGNIAF